MAQCSKGRLVQLPALPAQKRRVSDLLEQAVFETVGLAPGLQWTNEFRRREDIERRSHGRLGRSAYLGQDVGCKLLAQDARCQKYTLRGWGEAIDTRGDDRADRRRNGDPRRNFWIGDRAGLDYRANAFPQEKRVAFAPADQP